MATGDTKTTTQSNAQNAQVHDPYAQLVMAARNSSDQRDFLRQAIHIIGATFASPFGCIETQGTTGGGTMDEYHRGGTDPKFWRSALNRCIAEAYTTKTRQVQQYSAKQAAWQVGMVAIPFSMAGSSTNAMVGIVCGLNESSRESTLQMLQSLVDTIAQLVPLSGVTGAISNGKLGSALGRASRYESLEELAYYLTNNLRTKLDCQQAALGLVQRSAVKMLSISGLDVIPLSSPQCRMIRSAQEECFDAGIPLAAYPHGHDEDSHAGAADGFLLHGKWSAACGGGVLSIPVKDEEGTIAILSLQRAAGQPFQQDEIERIREAIAPYGPALLLLSEARRSLWQHGRDACKELAYSLTENGRVVRKCTFGVAVLLMTWFVFGTWTFEMTVPCVVVPKHVHHLSSPFDSTLLQLHKLPGDRVQAGEVILELDKSDLILQQRELAGELAVAEQERVQAIAKDDPATARMAEARTHWLSARMALLDKRIEQTVVRSPIDGVVSGDLRQMIGAPVPRGTPLLEITGTHDYTLEVLVPEYASGELTPALHGMFASSARPEASQPLKIERIHPQSSVRNGQTVFVAEATIQDAPAWLRPGMEGNARVVVGKRPVWWMALHGLLDYLRLRFWI